MAALVTTTTATGVPLPREYRCYTRVFNRILTQVRGSSQVCNV
jgi:hypothetical protein